jgi:uncharacterized membrane protein
MLMLLLVIGLALFIGVHSLSMLPGNPRARLVATLGVGPWRAIHAIITLAALAFIIVGFPAARASAPVLWVAPLALRYVAIAALTVVFPLALASVLGGCLKRLVHHPLLAAVQIWGLAHIAANGTLADVLLFGSLFAWAVAVRLSLAHRPPLVAVRTRTGPVRDVLAVVLGLAIYFAMLGGLHARLIGVAPLP